MVPGRPRRRSLIQAAGAITLGSLLREREATARALDQDERDRLLRGEVVRFPLDMELAAGDYFGGVSYAGIPAPPSDVLHVLNDPSTYTSILPLTLESRVIGKLDRDDKVFFKQGGKLGTASYVLITRREPEGLIRFWLDLDEPHDIADCWGFFRVEPWGQGSSLLTYAALLRLDFGPVKLLFTEKIRRHALGTPGLVRAYVRAHRRRAAEPHER